MNEFWRGEVNKWLGLARRAKTKVNTVDKALGRELTDPKDFDEDLLGKLLSYRKGDIIEWLDPEEYCSCDECVLTLEEFLLAQRKEFLREFKEYISCYDEAVFNGGPNNI